MRLFYEVIIRIIDMCDDLTKITFMSVSKLYYSYVDKLNWCENKDDFNNILKHNNMRLIIKHISKYQTKLLEIERLNFVNCFEVIKKRFNNLFKILKCRIIHHGFSFCNLELTKYILENNIFNINIYELKLKLEYVTRDNLDLFIEYNNRNTIEYQQQFPLFNIGFNDIVFEKQNRFNCGIVYAYLENLSSNDIQIVINKCDIKQVVKWIIRLDDLERFKIIYNEVNVEKYNYLLKDSRTRIKDFIENDQILLTKVIESNEAIL
jgi:hypothetical protein